jgi:hypothetical protein
MKRNLVSTRGGKHVINWPAVLLASLIVGAAGGGAAALMWFLLMKEFSLMAIIVSAALSLGWFVGTAVRQAYISPSEPVPLLDCSTRQPPRIHSTQEQACSENRRRSTCTQSRFAIPTTDPVRARLALPGQRRVHRACQLGDETILLARRRSRPFPPDWPAATMAFELAH